ncbi:preprotein translocase subunit TatC [Ensifer sp. 4252]|uniref:group III truncated hemoglobin n=1 Tax=Ensifer sp. 4252 TaxID=3373915 RepID=UPI003D232765
MSAGAITEADIRMVVERFYNEVRVDQNLNEAFSAITDWDDHLERMTEFWGSMMLSTGRYKGNPVAMHLIHLGRIQPEMFERWLALWKKVTSDALRPEVATEIQQRAARIASRLSTALFGAQRPDLQTLRPQISLQPYRSTPVFTEETIPRPLRQYHRLRPDI